MRINQELKQAGLTPRIDLIIYLKNVSDQYKLRRFGDIVYFSKKMKYCLLYVDRSEAEAKEKEIARLSFVKGVKHSEKDKVDLDSDHIEKQVQDLALKAEKSLQQQTKQDGDLLK